MISYWYMYIQMLRWTSSYPQHSEARTRGAVPFSPEQMWLACTVTGVVKNMTR